VGEGADVTKSESVRLDSWLLHLCNCSGTANCVTLLLCNVMYDAFRLHQW